MKAQDYIQMLVDSGVSVEDATDRAIQLGLMCCGAYCLEAKCCPFKTSQAECCPFKTKVKI